MSVSNGAAALPHHHQAAKIQEWESLADKHMAAGSVRVMGKHMAAGSVRVMGKPSTGPASEGAVNSDAAFLYRGAPLCKKNVGYFLSDMFKSEFGKLRAAGKSHKDASFEARDRCYAWSEKHRASIPDEDGGV